MRMFTFCHSGYLAQICNWSKLSEVYLDEGVSDTSPLSFFDKLSYDIFSQLQNTTIKQVDHQEIEIQKPLETSEA